MAELNRRAVSEVASRARSAWLPRPRTAFVIIVLLALLVGAHAWSATRQRPADMAAPAGSVVVEGESVGRRPMAGDQLPSFRAPDVRGGPAVAWPRDAGRTTRLVVFTSWCPSCRTELAKLADEPQDDVVGVLTGAGRYGQDHAAFIEETGVDFPVALDDDAQTLATALGVVRVPMMFHVDGAGTIERTIVGGGADDSCTGDADACTAPPE